MRLPAKTARPGSPEQTRCATNASARAQRCCCSETPKTVSGRPPRPSTVACAPSPTRPAATSSVACGLVRGVRQLQATLQVGVLEEGSTGHDDCTSTAGDERREQHRVRRARLLVEQYADEERLHRDAHGQAVAHLGVREERCRTAGTQKNSVTRQSFRLA
eukprot:2429228-Prymnesium_polylepis.3